MKTEIYIISGFLGAGKTTFIQKMLKEAFFNDKVVLIENDFGEISVDAALLKAGGVEVREINSGCICCSLSGDFVKAVKEIVQRFNPDRIVIEPSGVGKLSDIVKACQDERIRDLVEVSAKITVADVKRCQMYLDNFGEFFEDQIKHADVILLSRTEDFPQKAQGARDLIESLNPKAKIFSEPWREIRADHILAAVHTTDDGAKSHRHHEGCCHDHAAEAVFDTVTIKTDREFSKSQLQTCMQKVQDELPGTVLRAKGLVKSKGGYLDLQYVPGDVTIKKSAASGNVLCFIGKNLNRQELTALFDGE